VWVTDTGAGLPVRLRAAPDPAGNVRMKRLKPSGTQAGAYSSAARPREWLGESDTETHHSGPDKPGLNGRRGSFDDGAGDERGSEDEAWGVAHTHVVRERLRIEYGTVRAHGSSGADLPAECAASCSADAASSDSLRRSRPSTVRFSQSVDEGLHRGVGLPAPQHPADHTGAHKETRTPGRLAGIGRRQQLVHRHIPTSSSYPSSSAPSPLR